VHGAALRVLVAGLRSLGVLSGRSDRLIRDDAYRPYFMHGTSHWLGLDVHDVGKYRDGDGAGGVSPTVLRPGMVLTVEPGLYFGAGARAPRRLKGIGVRIEDDVLVTRGGRRNLSAAIPSDPDELEAMVGSAT
jgi:Xaa-Pro aminopeptidase